MFGKAGYQNYDHELSPPKPRVDPSSTYTGRRDEWTCRLGPRREYAPARELGHLDRRDRSPGPQAYDVLGAESAVLGESGGFIMGRARSASQGRHHNRSASSSESPPPRLIAWDAGLESKAKGKGASWHNGSTSSRSRRGSEATVLRNSYPPRVRASSSESPVGTPPHSAAYLDHFYEWQHAVSTSSSAALAEAAARTVAEANAEIAKCKRSEKLLKSQISRLQESNAQLAGDLSKSSEMLGRLEKEVSQLRRMQGRIDQAIEAAVLEERTNCERQKQHELAALQAENAKLRAAVQKSGKREEKKAFETRLLAHEKRFSEFSERVKEEVAAVVHEKVAAVSVEASLQKKSQQVTSVLVGSVRSPNHSTPVAAGTSWDQAD